MDLVMRFRLASLLFGSDAGGHGDHVLQIPATATLGNLKSLMWKLYGVDNAVIVVTSGITWSLMLKPDTTPCVDFRYMFTDSYRFVVYSRSFGQTLAGFETQIISCAKDTPSETLRFETDHASLDYTCR